MAGATVRVLEEIRAFTALGVRFWDPVLDVQVRDALRVRAWPDPGGRPVAEAVLTASDVYAFHRLPGLREIESPPPGAPRAASPPFVRRFVVEVEDTRRRFVPVAFAVELPLPYSGLFLVGAPASPAEPLPRGFYLYSAPSRPRPPWLAAVRGELADLAGGPVAHAVVRVRVPGEPVWHGLADEEGRFAVFLPWPLLPGGLGGSPPTGGPPAERSWSVRVEVLSQPDHLDPLPGTPFPDMRSVLRQAPAGVWPVHPDDGGLEEPDWRGELGASGELTVRTEGRAKLLVSPHPSSP